MLAFRMDLNVWICFDGDVKLLYGTKGLLRCSVVVNVVIVKSNLSQKETKEMLSNLLFVLVEERLVISKVIKWIAKDSVFLLTY